MEENITVSQVKEEDIPILTQFYVELSRDVEKETRDIYFVDAKIDESSLEKNLRKSLEYPENISLMAKAGQRAVGFISVSRPEKSCHFFTQVITLQFKPHIFFGECHSPSSYVVLNYYKNTLLL